MVDMTAAKLDNESVPYVSAKSSMMPNVDRNDAVAVAVSEMSGVGGNIILNINSDDVAMSDAVSQAFNEAFNDDFAIASETTSRSTLLVRKSETYEERVGWTINSPLFPEGQRPLGVNIVA